MSVTRPDTPPALPWATAAPLLNQTIPATSEIVPAAADIHANATGRSASRASGRPTSPDSAAIPIVEPIPNKTMKRICT